MIKISPRNFNRIFNKTPSTNGNTIILFIEVVIHTGSYWSSLQTVTNRVDLSFLTKIYEISFTSRNTDAK